MLFNSRKITIALLVLFAGFCFWQALPKNVSDNAANSLAPSATAEIGPSFGSRPEIETQAIETIRVGQRVLAHNPEVERTERLAWGPEPDFSQWLHLTLEMPKEDGSTLTIQMLRPDEWVDSQLSYVIDEAAESSRHAPRDEAERDELAEIENHRRDQPASQIASSATSLVTTTSFVEQNVNTATPHHAERDGYIVDAPLSPLRPVFLDILLTSLAAEEAGVELIGMTVQMDLPELGLTGEAIVTDIQGCPQIEAKADSSDDRRVVTATFHHSSGDVIDLVLADESSRHAPRDEAKREQTEEIEKHRRDESAPQNTLREASIVTTTPVVHQRSHSAMPHHAERDGYDTGSIGTTSNHPFWSVDRQEYIQAGHLEIGERLQTLHGHTKTVVSNLPRPGPKTDVYNLEVHAEHTYFVGEDGVLVHNNRVYTVADDAGQIVYVGKGTESRVATAAARVSETTGIPASKLNVRSAFVGDEFAMRGIEQRGILTALERQGGGLTARNGTFVQGNLANKQRSYNPDRLLGDKRTSSYKRAKKFWENQTDDSLWDSVAGDLGF